MKHMNFTTRQTKETIKLQPNYLWMAVFFVVVVLLIIAIGYVEKRKADDTAGRLAATSTEVGQMRAELAAKKGKDSSNASAMPALLSNPIAWADLLSDLSSKFPASARILRIDGSIADKRTLIIEATGQRLSSISEVKKNLADFKWCENIDLVSLHSEISAEQEQISFRLECQLR